MNNLKISVIMSVYKEPIEWLKLSIDSILNQTFPNFEFIIACDNPQYVEGKSLLNEYAKKDSRIVLIFNEQNIGLTKSLNKGSKIAKGKYIARMDADDIAMPTRFEKQFNYMETHEDVIVLGTNISYIGVGARWKMGDAVEFEDRLIKAHMLSENCIAHSSVFVRKSVLDKYGITYDETYRQSQDYRLWEMLREKGKFACLREKLLQYRLSAQQITNSSSGKQKGLADATRLRLQKAWLKSVGVLYSDNDLENHPAIVLDELRKRSDLKSQPEYRMFVHYVYMNSPESIGFVHSLLSGDITYLSHLNRIRIFVKMLKK